MTDNLQDGPVFGTVQPGSAAAAHDDLPPEPDGVKPMSSPRMLVPTLRAEARRTPAPEAEDPRLCNALMALLSTLENDRARLAQAPAGEVCVNADPEVQRLPKSGPPIQKCSAPTPCLPYGNDHARDRTPCGRRQECTPTWKHGPRSDAGSSPARSANAKHAKSTASTGRRYTRS